MAAKFFEVLSHALLKPVLRAGKRYGPDECAAPSRLNCNTTATQAQLNRNPTDTRPLSNGI
ncbi:hypothetical protein [Undibacterium sp. Xuan67W]|uniref:hypothetical protein n=1 Tax=Undibacterium sp. Xuan67W TaxID=3413057 RepID=UPI003BEFDDCF